MFRKLLGKSGAASKPSRTVDKLPAPLAKTILDALGLRSLPPMPGAAQKAFAVATNPKSDAEEFLELLESDEALAARVLKVANSVYYDRGQGSRTLADAVNVIGISELRGLLNANTLTDLFPSRHPLRLILWANGISCGLISRFIAGRQLPSLTEQAFLAGLMHDVGKLLLLQRHSDTYQKITKRANDEGVSFAEIEVLEYPFDHAQVGQLIGEQWNFAPELIATIARHHLPWHEIERNSVTGIVKAADIISHALGLGHPREFRGVQRVYEERLDEALSSVNIAPNEKGLFLASVRKLYADEADLYATSSGGNA
jgi:HD-like signal output (HDOD) protein